jgi:putative ABC transport system permease protein
MLMLKIAFRNLFRQKRRTILTALSMLGGFVLAAIFIGWTDGSYNNIIDMFTRNRLGHIQIHQKDYLDRPSLYKTIDNLPEISRIIEQAKGVDSWTPRLFSAGLASVGEETAAVEIFGVNPKRETLTTQFDKKIVKGKNFSASPSKEAIIGKGLATILSANLNDEVVIVSQAADGSIADDLYTIIGIAESGDDATDRISLYLNLKDAQELLALDGKVHEIAVTVRKLKDAKKVSGRLEKEINNPDLSVDPWQIFARSFYIAMKADKQGDWVMLLVIMIIVAVGVLNTVLMSVLERRREYGVLKAVGTKPSQIIKIVLYEVNILALICIVIGIGVGLLINFFLSTHGITLSTAFTYGGIKFQTLKSEINARSFCIPALTIIFAATVVSLFPAIRAGRTDPARSMRLH